jgi:sec-independent protein translocase protein TatC
MLIFVLARFGIVTARFLIKNIKYAVLIMFVAAAIITPDGSVVNQVVVAAPMVVLYFLSIVVAWLFGKKRDSEDEATA